MDQLTITYLGQCGFLLDFGDVRIATDPYLSDYVDANFASDSTPWKRLYPPPTSLLSLRPDLILISHSHGDHLDPWTLGEYIQSGGEALIAAPAPECDALETLNAPFLLQAESESSFSIGRVRITPIPCAHTELHADERGRYRELSYIIECGEHRVFFGGDMSLYPGLMERLAKARCTLLLLPVNGRDDERTKNDIIGNIDCREAAELATALNVPYFPMHHDLYAINGASDGEILSAAKKAGARVRILKPGQTLPIDGRAFS